jgi:hypothetical protein
MPIIRMPDGKQVRFPDDMSKDEIKGIISKKYPDAFKAKEKEPEKPSASIGDTALDAAISAGAGVTKGTLDLGTAPAELGTMARGAAEGLGVSKDTVDTISSGIKNTPILGQLFQGSQALRKLRKEQDGVMGSVNRYADYKPETTVGEYAKTVGEFAPGAVGGAEGLGLRALKYAVAPGIASEAAGQLTEGTKMEPYARGVAGLLGMGGAAGGLNRLGEKFAKSKLASADDFKKAGTDAYEATKKSGIYIKKDSMKKLFDDIEDSMYNDGYNPGNQNYTHNAMKRIRKKFDSGLFGKGAQTLSFSELDDISQSLGKEIKNLNIDAHGDRKFLWKAKHGLDDFMMKGMKRSDVYLGGNTSLPEAKELISNAKAHWTKKSKLDLLDQIEARGVESGKSVYTRGGEELGTRREVLKFLRKDKNKRQSFNKDELKALTKVAHGTYTGNAARWLGKSAGSPLTFGGAGTLGGGLGFLLGGGVPGMLIGAGVSAGSGLVGKALAKGITRRNLNDARSTIINGRKMRRKYKSKLGTLITLNQLSNNGD